MISILGLNKIFFELCPDDSPGAQYSLIIHFYKIYEHHFLTFFKEEQEF